MAGTPTLIPPQLPFPNFQVALIKGIYEFLPALPGEFGIFTVPLPRCYVRLMEKRGLL